VSRIEIVRELGLDLLQAIFNVIKLVDRKETKDEELLIGTQTNLVWRKWSVRQITLSDGSRQQTNQLVVPCLKQK
jgi:hypothetical protein